MARRWSPSPRAKLYFRTHFGIKPPPVVGKTTEIHKMR